jgi:hypothetical protein
MCGILIEYPELLDDAEVQAFLDLLEGVSAQVAVGVAKARILARDEAGAMDSSHASDGSGPPQQKTIDASVFLAQIPEAIHPFAFERLAAPYYETVELARENFLKAGTELRNVILGRETTEIAREQERVFGDDDESMRLAYEASERQRQRHGVK